MLVDLIIEDKVVVEVKALTGNIPAVFELQVLSYLKASGYRVGLLTNFGNKSCSSEAIDGLITVIFLIISVIRYNP
jgi:GxxExxY protein